MEVPPTRTSRPRLSAPVYPGRLRPSMDHFAPRIDMAARSPPLASSEGPSARRSASLRALTQPKVGYFGRMMMWQGAKSGQLA